MHIVEKKTSHDGSIKYALKTKENGLIEAVYYKFKGYDVENRPLLNDYKIKGEYPEYGICISSQVGCAMGCKFCATGYGGFFSNLTADEMQEQVDLIVEDIMTRNIETPDKIGNVVLMGMGEPLMNYNHVVKFCQSLQNRSKSKFIDLISVSTIGVLPKIKKLADEEVNIKLYFSIHSPMEKQRNELMPINLQYPLPKVIDTCIEYSVKRKEKIVACYLLIKEFNDSDEHAKALIELLPSEHFNLQLLNYNHISQIAYQRSERLEEFKQVIKRNSDLLVDVRISKGQQVEGGCGQLVQNLSGKSIRERSLK